jgi:hypothetical protein
MYIYEGRFHKSFNLLKNNQVLCFGQSKVPLVSKALMLLLGLCLRIKFKATFNTEAIGRILVL